MACALALALALLGLTAPSRAVDLAYAPAPVDNPLKGFVPYDGLNTNFPHSLEFFYLPLAGVQTGYTDFDWSSLERKLDGIAGRGHQAVFRFYLDYPNLPSGLPQFLRNVPVHDYDDWGNGVNARSVSPDYQNTDLRRALTNFVAALGARYDGDPRVGFVTAGLLGFWGEWHTYPYNGIDRPTNWFAPTTVQREVLDAYAAAFRVTPLLLREPKPGVNISARRLGFHDDSFAYSTLGPEAWHFWPVIKSYGLANVWRTQPIGGEIRPELWDCIWSEPSCAPPGQQFLACVETTHASWLLDSGTFKGITGANRDRALAGARRLGYELYASSVEMPQWAAVGGLVRIAVTVTNTGVAPFYFRWPVQLAFRGRDGTWWQRTNDWDLPSVRPGEPPVRFEFNGTLDNIAAGPYTVLLAALNPLSRGRPLRFANQAQDTVRAGWLTLGLIEIQLAPTLSRASLRQGYFEFEISQLRSGTRTEIQRAADAQLLSWEAADSFTPPAATYVWRQAEPAGQRAFFRVVQHP